MIDKLNKDDIYTLFTFLGHYIDDKKKLVEELTDHMEMKDFSDCSKMELEAIGRRYGIELDRRKKKETLIEELKEVLDDEVQIT